MDKPEKQRQWQQHHDTMAAETEKRMDDYGGYLKI